MRAVAGRRDAAVARVRVTVDIQEAVDHARSTRGIAVAGEPVPAPAGSGRGPADLKPIGRGRPVMSSSTSWTVVSDALHVPDLEAVAEDDDAVHDHEDVVDVVADEQASSGPPSLASRMKRMTPSASSTPRLFVGSSMMMRSASKNIARAMAMAWRSPPDRRAMGVSGSRALTIPDPVHELARSSLRT